jgi:N-terminal domain of oxidoreductase/Zinc-binding dehydrogenase
VEAPLPELADSEVLLKTVYLSVDPYMRGRITGVKSYADPINIGDVMLGGAVGQVVKSKSPDFQPGDFAVGFWGWREFGVESAKTLRKLNPAMGPVSLALGLLGMCGLTAYFGFLELCNPKPGETVVVSGAAGAVGSIVGQIAKIKECRVVGIAGEDAKIAWVTKDLGFDAAFNYKTTSDYRARLQELCPRRHRLLFRQCWRSNHRCCLSSTQHLRARIGVRSDLAIQPGKAGAGTTPSALHPGEASPRRRLYRYAFHGPVAGRHPAAGDMAQRGKTEIPGTYSRGLREHAQGIHWNAAGTEYREDAGEGVARIKRQRMCTLIAISACQVLAEAGRVSPQPGV